MMENYDTQNNKHCQHLGAFCPHVKEHGVQCDTESSCTNCGWNPRVAAERKAKIQGNSSGTGKSNSRESTYRNSPARTPICEKA